MQLLKITLVAFALLLVMSCQKEETFSSFDLTKVITLQTGDKLSVPDSFEHKIITGFGYTVGELVSEPFNMAIRYQAGELAHQLVVPDSDTDFQVSKTALFWWKSEGGHLMATFAENGPLSFIVEKENPKTEINNDSIFLTIMRSFDEE